MFHKKPKKGENVEIPDVAIETWFLETWMVYKSSLSGGPAMYKRNEDGALGKEKDYLLIPCSLIFNSFVRD